MTEPWARDGAHSPKWGASDDLSDAGHDFSPSNINPTSVGEVLEEDLTRLNMPPILNLPKSCIERCTRRRLVLRG
ncbi:hypothetical protein BO443_220025 [Burkholderia orbicola]